MIKTKNKLRSISNWLMFASIILSSFSPAVLAMNFRQTEDIFNKSLMSQSPITSIFTEDKKEQKIPKSVKKHNFEENRGQFDKSVRFVSQRPDQSIFFTANEAVFTMPIKGSKNKSFALRMELNGANKHSTLSGLDAVVGKTNYFRGKDKSNWQSNVSAFAKVKYEKVYKGIDVLWYNNDAGELEYDFIVEPKADFRQIELEFKGAEKLEINQNGDLLIHTKAGILQQRKPFSYQTIDGNRQEVASRYELHGKNKVRFVVGDYDSEKQLVIDPVVMTYSTFLGGSNKEGGNDIAVDNQGNVYIVGSTRSSDFPTTIGTYDDTINGTSSNVFVTKFDSTGMLVYSTFIGGNSNSGDYGNGIDVDNLGNAYIVGKTYSDDYPVTPNAFSQVKKGAQYSYDAFVTKINADGSDLVYSTFLGGTSSDDGYDIAVDSNGNASVVGETSSYSTTIPENSFPTTKNSLTAPNGGGFYTKLNGSGSALIYSTYLSGSSYDEARRVVTDNSDNVYVMGVTSSSDFPVKDGSFDTTHNGQDDIFVSKFSGSNLVYSTFLGGSSYDGINNGFGLAVDDSGNCYILAPTGSDDFPTTEGALDRTQNNYEAFVAKLNPQGSELMFSTFLSPLNNGPNYGYALAVDAQSNVYVLGKAGAQSFPGIDCLYDRYIAQIAPDGSAFKEVNCFASSFGDSKALVIDSAKNLYTTGYSYSNSYPTTDDAFDNTSNGSDDVVYTKFRVISGATRVDFDGDGRSDPSVYRDGMWYMLRSAQGDKASPFGLAGDVPTSADFDGDGKTDIAVWRAHPTQSNFYILESSTNTLKVEGFGIDGDDPTVVGDYDGDGKADVAVYRDASVGQQSYFYFRGSLDNPGGDITFTPWGTQNDKPAIGDYDGDGKVDFAVFRPSEGLWYILDNATHIWRVEQFGLSTDKIVQADYDGDAKTDIAVFRPSTGVWYIKKSSVEPTSPDAIQYERWGLGSDTLVPADYDGDGKVDVAVWRDGYWYYKQSSDGSANLRTRYGISTDKPIQSFMVH